MSSFATLALMLAVAGMYTVMSYVTSQRTAELGLRVALGACASDLERLVLGGAARLVAIGVGLGLLLALLTSRVLATLLAGRRTATPFAPNSASRAWLGLSARKPRPTLAMVPPQRGRYRGLGRGGRAERPAEAWAAAGSARPRSDPRLFGWEVSWLGGVIAVPKPIEVRARAEHRLWLRYDDGTEGEVDLSALVGRGVFQAWKDIAVFEAVRLGPYGEIAWGEDLDLCPDALYMRLTGKRPEQVFPTLGQAEVNA